jgi:hypothetical protein
MDADLTKALETVRRGGASPDEYRAACEYLAEHRDALPCRVYINLPGGLGGNADPIWAKVKELTQERCSCGNERVIIPLNQRSAYERSPAGPVTVAKGKPVYLKPVGGDKASAYLMFDVIDADGGPALEFVAEPFAPLVLTPAIFSSQGYMLSKLAEVLPKQAGPAVMTTGKPGVPVCAIDAADVAAATVTITPDKDVEVFDPETWTDAHVHGA